MRKKNEVLWIASVMSLAMACGHTGSSTEPDGSLRDGATQDVRGDAVVTNPTDVAHADGNVVADTVVQSIPDAGPTGLPDLPAMTNVTATQREDSVGIDFDPFDSAVDYRVYPLPAPGDITINSDGSTTIRNAVYRCSGLRQTFDLENNVNTGTAGLAVFNPPYNWKSHADANPTLGYVYVTPGAGRIPVYAVAGYMGQDELGWRESRPKIYTTDDAQRQMLLSQNWRDDGIAFYIPAAAGADTQTIYTSQDSTFQDNHVIYYFPASQMSMHTGDMHPPTAAFQVLAAASAADGTQPLMAVRYDEHDVHTELAVGHERYMRALNQGVGPLWHLEWQGISQPTTLVVEALKTGCPFQGFLSPQHLAAPPHQTLYTLDELKSASPTGQAFINGQFDGTTESPVAIARSFIQVSPQPHVAADWDWYQGFNVGTDLGPVTMIDFMGSQTHLTCTWEGCRGQDSVFDFSAYELDAPNNVALFTHGQFQGQFWEAFDDTGQDVTGKVRFTARQLSSVSANSFLHVTMSVNIVSTDRRYPQMIISDQPIPIDHGLSNPNANMLLIQNIMGPSMRLETQAVHGLVNGSPWAVNNQAPEHRFIDYWANYGLSDQAFAALNASADSPFEHAGVDRQTRFDAFISSQRLYLFMDGAPAGCTQYPSGFALNGAVAVSFGDVFYHEGAQDELVCADERPYGFLHRHQCQETTRHFDDLGFKSGVPAPQWDETRLPCQPY